MTTYGLRNIETGRFVRVAQENKSTGYLAFRLSEDVDAPRWETVSLADLVTLIVEDRPEYESTLAVPAWGGFRPELNVYQPVRFRSEFGYDVEGGDPVTKAEWIETFNLGDVYDFRQPISQTRSIDNTHYGVLQALFTQYDMDRHENMSVALIAHKEGGVFSLRGDIGLTSDRGPARIVGVADVPEDWPISDDQLNHKPFDDTKWSLLLLDKTELENWVDFERIDTKSSLSPAA